MNTGEKGTTELALLSDQRRSFTVVSGLIFCVLQRTRMKQSKLDARVRHAVLIGGMNRQEQDVRHPIAPSVINQVQK